MGRLRFLAALVLVAVASAGLSARAVAQSDKQQELQEQANEASAGEQAARAKLADAQAAHERADAALADVTTRLAAANARLAEAQANVDRLAAIAADLQVKADATQKKLDAARDDVRNSAVLLYRHGDGADMLGLLDSTSASGTDHAAARSVADRTAHHLPFVVACDDNEA